MFGKKKPPGTRIQSPASIMMNSSLYEFQKTQLVIISDFMEAIFHVQTSFWQGLLLNKVCWTADATEKPKAG